MLAADYPPTFTQFSSCKVIPSASAAFYPLYIRIQFPIPKLAACLKHILLCRPIVFLLFDDPSNAALSFSRSFALAKVLDAATAFICRLLVFKSISNRRLPY